MLQNQVPEVSVPFKCPYGCPAAYQHRWEATRHAKQATCREALSLTQGERMSALAQLSKPQKEKAFCDVCQVELKGHGRLPAHVASAAHRARLAEPASASEGLAKMLGDDKAQEEEKQIKPSPPASGLYRSPHEREETAQAPARSLDEDLEWVALPAKRGRVGQETEPMAAQRIRKHERKTCECGSVFRGCDAKAHLATHKHQLWVKEEPARVEKAKAERECEEMAKEDTRGKIVELIDKTTRSKILFKLYKEAAIYKAGAIEGLQQGPAPKMAPGLNEDHDSSSDDEMVAEKTQLYLRNLERSLPEAVALNKIERDFRRMGDEETRAMSKEQLKRLEQNFGLRYQFQGQLHNAVGRCICLVAVLTSCPKYESWLKTQSQEASDRRGYEVRRPGRPKLVFKTSCHVLDRSCRNKPRFLHFFGKGVDGLPSTLGPNKVRVIALHKAKTCKPDDNRRIYFYASSASSWAVCSLDGAVIERYGKGFCPPPDALRDILLLAREVQARTDEGIPLPSAAPDCLTYRSAERRKHYPVVRMPIANLEVSESMASQEEGPEARGPSSGGGYKDLCG